MVTRMIIRVRLLQASHKNESCDSHESQGSCDSLAKMDRRGCVADACLENASVLSQICAASDAKLPQIGCSDSSVLMMNLVTHQIHLVSNQIQSGEFCFADYASTTEFACFNGGAIADISLIETDLL